jgi:hypothetical protein
MAANSKTYYNPTITTFNSVARKGVTAITVNESGAGITSTADAEAFNSVAGIGDRGVSGSISFRDPVEARAFMAATGTLIASFAGLAGAAALTLTITGVQPLSVGTNVSHNAASNCSVSFIAAKDDGTQPVTLA